MSSTMAAARRAWFDIAPPAVRDEFESLFVHHTAFTVTGFDDENETVFLRARDGTFVIFDMLKAEARGALLDDDAAVKSARAGALVNTRTRAQANVVIWKVASRRAAHAAFLGRRHHRWLVVVVAHSVDFIVVIGLGE